MKKLTQFLFVILCLSFGKVHADDVEYQTLVNDVYRLQVDVYEASTLFHMFTLLEGDRQVSGDIEQVVVRIQSQLKTILASGLLSDDEHLSEAAAKFIELVRANEIASEGYTSVYTVNDMEAALDEFQKSLNELLPEGALSSQASILSNAVLVRKIGSRYARLAAHWNARTGILADADGDTIDVHTKIVTEQLEELVAKGDLTPQERASVSQAIKKWRFISPKLIDYQNDTVPYLVSRYSTSIANQLLSAL
ncbi:hypothetical protein [Parendozoicomonas sp. Alg238-R29]|uniref:hypothetical protein n=1 Tax=Parendozoicomonas sp. Alg238-R29 TaxID=2993446 RepID=UPI00248F3661|nr:hypothetical protein [Parendozoicomonas sp. Alg238-R29]